MLLTSSGRADALARRLSYALFVCVCFSAAPLEAQPNVVRGTVRTADGRPLAGAVIRVSGATGAARGTTRTTKSDQNGNYQLEVPPGHYDVDAFSDLTFDGQTYREIWLDRTNQGCERQLSESGIVRHFVLRLSGLMRCRANFDPGNMNSYAGATVVVVSAGLPAAASVRFTFTPVGPLADGSRGRVLTFDRTAEMLARSGGRLGETAWLHDIPLARYRVSAEAVLPGGRRQTLALRDNAGGQTASAIELGFPAYQMAPYGIRSASLTIAGAADGMTPPPPTPDDVAPGPSKPIPPGGGLPTGRYECSYRSPYAGEIPTSRTIVILDGGRYQAWGGSGNYSRSGGAVQWASGPFAQRGVSVTFTNEGGGVLVVKGGAAASDPDGTNRCVRR